MAVYVGSESLYEVLTVDLLHDFIMLGCSNTALLLRTMRPKPELIAQWY